MSSKPCNNFGAKKAPYKTPQLVLANNCDEYYIFNDKANSGYVIVSADERTEDIIGYSTESSFDKSRVPEGLRDWLDTFSASVRQMRHDSKDVSSIRYTVPVNPLIKTQWDQWAPYNLLCPIYNDWQCPTGCVNTAIAEIMNYYRDVLKIN